MLQKEVVERLASGPGTSDYGRPGIMAQYYCKVEAAVHSLAPGSFNPPPKVDSGHRAAASLRRSCPTRPKT